VTSQSVRGADGSNGTPGGGVRVSPWGTPAPYSWLESRPRERAVEPMAVRTDLRERFNAFVVQHEVAWELGMGALAIGDSAEG
jgi:hypothetical protein